MLHFAFIQNCQYYEVDHLDGNKENNTLWNLEWVTPQENVHRAIKNQLRTVSCTSNKYDLLSNDEAIELYNLAIQVKDYSELSTKYNVSEDYINDLVKGTIRPYIAQLYYSNHNHYIPSE